VQDQAQEAENPRGISVLAMNAAVALLLFVFGAVIIYDTWRLGSGWAKDGPQAGYFPFRIGVLICVASFIVFVQSFRHRQSRGALFVEYAKLKLVAAVFIPSILYVLGIQLLGFYLPSALFIAIFMIWLGRYPVWKGLLVGVAVSLVTFWLFEIQFKVPLAKGPLEALLGY
jgi:putative tricarboxylic transport membrane protein